MKYIIRYVVEICLALSVILISYPIWKARDVKAYEKEIEEYQNISTEVYVDDNFNHIFLLSDKEKINDDKALHLNNYRDKKDNFQLILVLNNIDDNLMNNLYLLKRDDVINLNDVLVKKESNGYYFLVDNVELDSYEKLEYNLHLMVNDGISLNLDKIDYNFIKQ